MHLKRNRGRVQSGWFVLFLTFNFCKITKGNARHQVHKSTVGLFNKTQLAFRVRFDRAGPECVSGET